MAFSGSVMPKIKLIHGVSKSVIDPVLVVGNGSRETRRKQNRYERFAWKYPARSILQSSKQELYTFFRTTNSSLDSFMFQDPDYPEFNNVVLYDKVNEAGYEDCWYFGIPIGTGYLATHPLFNHQDINTLVMEIHGNTVYPATGGLEYHHVNGRPVIRIADGDYYSNNGQWPLKIVSGPCYMTARLNSALGWSIAAMDKSPNGTTCTPTPTIVDMADIELIEVFEHA